MITHAQPRRLLAFSSLLVTLALGAALAPGAPASPAGGDQSPSYTGPGGGGRGGVPHIRLSLIGRPGARSLAHTGSLRIRVTSNVGAFVIVRSAIRGAGGPRVRGIRAPGALGIALVRPGSTTRILRLPARLRASLRGARGVSISLRAVGQSAFGVVGRATLARRLGR